MSVTKIVARLDRELVPKGFHRKKRTWNRERDSLVEVVDIQVSKSGDRVTLNAGVLSRPVFFACWGHEAEPFIQEPECTVRARIGSLMDDDLDRWWDLGRAESADEMADCIGTRILPFVERMRSLEAMRDWLSPTGRSRPKYPLTTICYAVVQSQLGDTRGACTTLAELESKALGGWSVRAQEVAVRIGCASVDPG